MSGNSPSKSARSFGPFELLDKIGQGGMGSVYKAFDVRRSRVVALKIASRLVANEPTLLQRFEKEFTVASQLSHPHIVKALEFGTEGNLPYLVFEFVAGRSLSNHIKEIGPLPLNEALAVFEPIAEAIGFIHANQIIHRDIKPANILIDLRGRAKLTDLGLLKDLDSSVLLTQSQMGLGTLDYGAPEQFDDAKNVDFRCDIYGLAASLYVALTGQLPYASGSQMQILMAKMEHRMIPISQILPGVSPSLDQTIIRALHPDPNVRPHSAAEFMAGIRGETPLTDIAPPPPRKPADPVDERRNELRHAIRLPARVESTDTTLRDYWQGNVVDISLTGLCLRTSWRIEPGTRWQAYLPGHWPGQQSIHPIRARWHKALQDKTWLIGCSFNVQLTEEELERYLLSDLSRTDIGRRKS